MNWQNDITSLLDITYPIIQAPMLHVSTPEMVAAAARSGCLGSLSLGDLAAEQCLHTIRSTKEISPHAFATNIFVYEIPSLPPELRQLYAETASTISAIATENNLEISIPRIEDLKLTDYREQVEVLIQAGCKIVSYTFGNLDAASINKLKSAGCTLIGTCTSVAEAIILEESGIDIICIQGYEAGGHRGSFASTATPDIGGFALLPQVRDAVKLPLVYAGGIADARSLVAAKTLGAQGFQLGSIFLRAEESALRAFEKERLKNAEEQDIVLTKSYSGRYARGLKTAFTETFDAMPEILPYPYQNKLTASLRAAAKQAQLADFVSIWSGSSLAAKSDASTEEILKGLLAEVVSYG